MKKYEVFEVVVKDYYNNEVFSFSSSNETFIKKMGRKYSNSEAPFVEIRKFKKLRDYNPLLTDYYKKGKKNMKFIKSVDISGEVKYSDGSIE